MTNVAPGEVVTLPEPPDAVIVEFTIPDPVKNPGLAKKRAFLARHSLIPNRYVVPIGFKSNYGPSSREHSLHSIAAAAIGLKTCGLQKMAVQMKFALTDYKLQGKTVERLILAVNKRVQLPWFSLTSLTVMMSRVRSGKHLRRLPMPEDSDFDHLVKLEHSKYLEIWRNGYNTDGMWDPALAIAAKQERETRQKMAKEDAKILKAAAVKGQVAPPATKRAANVNTKRETVLAQDKFLENKNVDKLSKKLPIRTAKRPPLPKKAVPTKQQRVPKTKTKINDISRWFTDVDIVEAVVRLTSTSAGAKPFIVNYPIPEAYVCRHLHEYAVSHQAAGGWLKNALQGKYSACTFSDGLHWRTICCDGENSIVYCMDPLGKQSFSANVLLHLRTCLPGSWTIIVLDYRLQNDGFQCGPWAIWIIQKFWVYCDTGVSTNDPNVKFNDYVKMQALLPLIQPLDTFIANQRKLFLSLPRETNANVTNDQCSDISEVERQLIRAEWDSKSDKGKHYEELPMKKYLMSLSSMDFEALCVAADIPVYYKNCKTTTKQSAIRGLLQHAARGYTISAAMYAEKSESQTQLSIGIEDSNAVLIHLPESALQKLNGTKFRKYLSRDMWRHGTVTTYDGVDLVVQYDDDLCTVKMTIAEYCSRLVEWT
jgi:hypothetical protein